MPVAAESVTDARRSAIQSVASSGPLQLEALEPRQLLAQLIGILPNDGQLLEEGQILHVAPTQLTFRFDETPPALDPSTIPANIVITRSGLDGVFGNGNDVVIQPGYIGVGESSNEAIVRFAATLPDDVYRIDAYGERLDFELDLGAQVTAVVPQPIQRIGGALTQARDQIVVYFNNDDLDPASAQDPRFYQLIFTNDTATNTDDGPVHRPISVQYDAGGRSRGADVFGAAGGVVDGTRDLSFADWHRRSGPVAAAAHRAGPAMPVPALRPPSTWGRLGAARSLSAQIEDRELYPLEFPGGNNDPGHRDLPLGVGQPAHSRHDLARRQPRADARTTRRGSRKIGFVFRDSYGFDPFGVPLRNLITEPQRQRTREIFELYGQYIGAQFFEVDQTTLPDLVAAEIPFFSIATGDMRAVDPVVVTGPGGVEGIAGGVLDPELGRGSDGDRGRGGAVRGFLRRHLVSGGDGDWSATCWAPATPTTCRPGTITSDQVIAGYTPEPMFPGDNDIVHAQHLFRPEGRDIDMYRFELTETGLFTAETMAERLFDVSQLDTVLNLYREDSAGNRVLVSRNDDYFSNDSFIADAVGAGHLTMSASVPAATTNTIRSSRTTAWADARKDITNCVSTSVRT